MNDWPADPRLDESLRRLVDTELAAARNDAAGLSRRPEIRRGRGGRATVGLGALAVIAIVASLAVRGMTTGGSSAGGPDASESPLPSSFGPTNAASRVASGSFSPTGTMTTSDNGPGILLLDGRVLIVGNGATSPELYDPKTGTFSRTGEAVRDGNFGSATRLADGRVLFVGGSNEGTVLASAQVFDPATGKFSPTGSLITGRVGHTATLLADGRVLIAGGSTWASHPGTATAMLASAELYDPKTGKFSPTGSMTTGRDAASATLLSDGRVLIAGGGDEGNAPVASAELYDPKTGKFSPTGSMLIAQYGQVATLLPDGRVLIAGGNDGQRSVYSLEVYDPKTGTFSATGPPGQNVFGTPALLHDGRVLFVGGYDDSAPMGSNYLASCKLFDPATGKLTPTGSLSIGRAPSVTTLLDGRVLVTDGFAAGDPRNLTAEVYQP
jgi:WD40 repeat protein